MHLPSLKAPFLSVTAEPLLETKLSASFFGSEHSVSFRCPDASTMECI